MVSPKTNLTHSEILRRYQGRQCCYCETHMRHSHGGTQFPNSETIEHLHRKCEGGSNDIRNKALACYECNTGRGDVDWLTWKSFKMGEIPDPRIAA